MASRGPGRPTAYTEAIGQVICSRIAEGESLRSICEDAGMPDRSTVARWLPQHGEFRAAYVVAREMQADLHADEILALADACSEEAGAVAKARVQIDARKWWTSKVAPKKYGDRQEHHVGGLEGGAVEISWAQGPDAGE